jgi:hypothetical protein
MEIRWATIFDFSHICAMLTAMHTESEIKLGPINPKKLSEAVLRTINDGVVLIALDDSGKIIGSIGGGAVTEWWSDDLIFGDIWFYVYKQNRESKAGIKLIKKFIEAGAGMQIKLGHIYNGDMSRKDMFYERLGLNKVGSTYIMENK